MSEMNKKDLLFEPAIDGVEEADYARMMPGVLAMAKGMDSCFSQGTCVFDWYKQDIIYMSDHLSNFLKVERESPVKIDDLLNIISEQELTFYSVVMKEARRFYDKLPESERLEYVFSFPLQIQMENFSLSVYRRMMPIALSHTGKIWLMLCSSYSAARNFKRVVYMQKKNSDYRLKFNVKTQLWEKVPLYFPNCNRDKSILALASQGLSINEIADVLQMTPDAVKACRRRLFEQMGVSSMQEAITYMMNHLK